MNPIAEGLDHGRLPPLADVRRNLHIRWYRCPIERERLRELAAPRDSRGLMQAAGHLGLWAATGASAFYCFTHQLWWGFFVALFAHGTVASFFTAPHHELCHTTVFRTKWLNEVFLRVFSLLGWLNFHVYRFSHSYHHRYTLFIAGDREEVMPETPSLRFLYLLQLFTVNVTGGYQSRGSGADAEEFHPARPQPPRQSLQLVGPGALRGASGRGEEGRGLGADGAAVSRRRHHRGGGAGGADRRRARLGLGVHRQLAPVLRRRAHALRAAHRRGGLPQVRAHHHPRPGVGVPLLAHELAPGAPHVRGLCPATTSSGCIVPSRGTCRRRER